MQTPDALPRRAQFQLWIFSYTVLARPSKKGVSRLKIERGDGLSIVARMERSGMREHRPRISLRSIRATNLGCREHHARRRVRSASLRA